MKEKSNDRAVSEDQGRDTNQAEPHPAPVQSVFTSPDNTEIDADVNMDETSPQETENYPAGVLVHFEAGPSDAEVNVFLQNPAAENRLDHSQDVMSNNEMAKTVEKIPNGDVTLVIGTRENQKRFLVSRQIMMLASPVWKMMFDARFAEATMTEIPLEGDNPDAMEILLNISHLNFAYVPQTLDIQTLYHVAEIVDKYDLANLMIPFRRNWLRPILTTGTYQARPISPLLLFIAWVFGEVDLFTVTCLLLIIRSPLKKNGGREQETERAVLQPSLESLVDVKMPPGVYKDILDLRVLKIRTLFSMVQDRIKKGFSESSSCHLQDAACDATLLGSFLRSLASLGMYPLPDPTEYALSIEELCDQLGSITLEEYTGVKPATTPKGKPTIIKHLDCLNEYHLRKEVLVRVANEIEAPLDEIRANHMDDQKQKTSGRVNRKRMLERE